MVIVFVVPEFVEKDRHTTGLPNYIYRVSLALLRFKHEPIVITAGHRNEKIIYNGIKVIRKKINKKLNFKQDYLNYLYISIKMNIELTRELKELEKRKKIDVIQFCSIYGLGILYRGEVPSVLRLSSYAAEYYKYSNTFSKQFVKMAARMERLCSKNRNKIFAPSNVMAVAFKRDIRRKVDVIETPFVNDVIQEDERVYRKYLMKKKYALFFGTLYAEKGIYIIKDVIHDFLNRYKDFCFVFIGDIQINNNINPMILIKRAAKEFSDRVIYIKPLRHELLYPIIKNSSIVVLPSLMDNFPNACIEAMYFKRIVIGTEGTSFEQLITDGRNGFLAKPGEADSLYEKIKITMELSKEEAEIIGCAAKKRIDLLQPEFVVNQLIKYYRNII